MHEKINNFGICEWSRDYFQQTQITRRIEKMCTTEMFFKIITSAFCH